MRDEIVRDGVEWVFSNALVTKDGQANSEDALLCPAQLERSRLSLPLIVVLVAQR